MCGIFGWNLSKASENILDADKKKSLAELLSTVNDRRGGDSWGYYGHIKGQEDFILRKGLGKITPQTDNLLEYSVLMAHCRNATTGEVTVENAHPFKVENIIGAHNGCIYNHDELNTKYNRECEVDSEHIIHHIKDGLEMKEIIGYGSVQWVNLLESKEKIYLLKQNQSIRVAKLLDKDENAIGTIWSSLMQDVYTFLDKQNIAYVDFEFKEGPIHYVLDSGFYFDADRKMYFGSDDSIRNAYKYRNNTNKNSKVYNIYSNNSWVDQLHPKKRTRSSSMDKLLSAAKKLLFSSVENETSSDDGSKWFEKENEPIQKDYDSDKVLLWSRRRKLTEQINNLQIKINNLCPNQDEEMDVYTKSKINTLYTKLARKKECLEDVQTNLDNLDETLESEPELGRAYYDYGFRIGDKVLVSSAYGAIRYEATIAHPDESLARNNPDEVVCVRIDDVINGTMFVGDFACYTPECLEKIEETETILDEQTIKLTESCN